MSFDKKVHLANTVHGLARKKGDEIKTLARAIQGFLSQEAAHMKGIGYSDEFMADVFRQATAQALRRILVK